MCCLSAVKKAFKDANWRDKRPQASALSAKKRSSQFPQLQRTAAVMLAVATAEVHMVVATVPKESIKTHDLPLSAKAWATKLQIALRVMVVLKWIDGSPVTTTWLNTHLSTIASGQAPQIEKVSSGRTLRMTLMELLAHVLTGKSNSQDP